MENSYLSMKLASRLSNEQTQAKNEVNQSAKSFASNKFHPTNGKSIDF